MSAPPFTVRRTAPAGPLRCRITLQLHEAADEDKRRVVLSYEGELRAGVAPGDSLRQQLHEFVTQVHEYAAAAAAPDGNAAQQQGQQAAAPAAAAPEQQPKRQKTEA